MNIEYQPLNDFHIDTLNTPYSYDMPFFHYHSCYELFIILSGKRKMIIHDKILQGKKGDIFLIPPKYFHRTSGSGCKRIVINFSYEYLNKYFYDKIINKMLTCFDVFQISLPDADLDFVLNQCKYLFNTDTTNPNNTIFIDLAKLLFFLTEKMDYNLDYTKTDTAIRLASNILSYINNNYKALSTLEQIAENFFISKEYLCRIFKKNVGVTTISYLTGLKLKHACSLLCGSQKNMMSIADECGFSSPSYFSKIFKDNFNMSPAEYRRKNSLNDILSENEENPAQA